MVQFAIDFTKKWGESKTGALPTTDRQSLEQTPADKTSQGSLK